MTGNAPTIDQTLALLVSLAEEYDPAPEGGTLTPNEAIIDFLHGHDVREIFNAVTEKLAAIESQPVPVEPGFLPVMRKLAAKNLSGSEDAILIRYIDSLTSALQRAQEELKTAQHTGCGEKVIEAYKERAEKAESLNRRMVELMKEPSDGMVSAGMKEGNEQASHGQHCEDVFKAMSAELLKEATK